MAKGNLLLGTAYNKLGDIVLMRKDGWQQSRVRVRKISNPKTMPQAVNRALLGTIGTAYSYMKAILDHSFQGLSKPVQNQRKFQALAQSIARATGSLNIPSTDEGFNFNFKGEKLLRPNPWPLSRGTMPGVPSIPIKVNNRLGGFTIANDAIDWFGGELTYQDFCDHIGVPLGAQLTFCVINDDTFSGTPSGNNVPFAYGNFHFARIILAPDDGDGSKLMWEQDETYKLITANANSRNEGSVEFALVVDDDEEDRVVMIVNGKRYPIAAGIIVSDYNGRWLRSNTDMVVSSGYESSNTISEVYGSYMLSEASAYSDLYLNQASTEVGGDSDVPIYVAPPVITGDNQFQDTGSVTITAASGATIYYTLDGSTPTTESTEYSGTITLLDTTTVKAIAVKNNVVSSVASKQFVKTFEG